MLADLLKRGFVTSDHQLTIAVEEIYPYKKDTEILIRLFYDVPKQKRICYKFSRYINHNGATVKNKPARVEITELAGYDNSRRMFCDERSTIRLEIEPTSSNDLANEINHLLVDLDCVINRPVFKQYEKRARF